MTTHPIIALAHRVIKNHYEQFPQTLFRLTMFDGKVVVSIAEFKGGPKSGFTGKTLLKSIRDDVVEAWERGKSPRIQILAYRDDNEFSRDWSAYTTLLDYTDGLDSIRSWMKEFYPIPADQIANSNASNIDLLQHSLDKWRGLLPENIKKHNVWIVKDKVLTYGLKDIDMADHAKCQIDRNSCSLCVSRRDLCDRCPFSKHGNACTHPTLLPNDRILLSPWRLWTLARDARLMIIMLEFLIDCERGMFRTKEDGLIDLAQRAHRYTVSAGMMTAMSSHYLKFRISTLFV